MLSNHTHERLAALGLAGMAKAFDDQQRQPDVTALTFEQRLGLMIDREATERENKRLIVRLKFASLRQTAIVEDVDLRAPRGIDRAFFAKLVDGDWIGRKQNLLITGPTGVGKSWIACALGHKACRDNRSVLYHRLPRLFEALALARGDGRYARLLKTLSRVNLLILDDWGLAPLTGEQRRDLLEVVDDRHQRGSTIITSQVPIENWHEVIADPTIADAVLDRLVHNAHRLALKGDSMKKPHPIDELAALHDLLSCLETGEMTLRRGNVDVSKREIGVLKPTIAYLEQILERIKSERKSERPINYSGRTKRFSRNDK